MTLIQNTLKLLKRFAPVFILCFLSFTLLEVEHIWGRLPLSFIPFYKPNAMILWLCVYVALASITIKLCDENHTSSSMSQVLWRLGIFNTIYSFSVTHDVQVFWILTFMNISAILALYVWPFLHKTEEEAGDFLCHVVFLLGIGLCCLGCVGLSYGLIYFALMHLFHIDISIPKWLWFHLGNAAGFIALPLCYLSIINYDVIKWTKTRMFISYLFTPVLLVLGSIIWIYGFKMAWQNIMPPEGKTLIFIWAIYPLGLCGYILSYNRYGRDKEWSKAFAIFLFIPLFLAIMSLSQKIYVDGILMRRSFELVFLLWLFVATIGIFWKQSIKIIVGSLSIILFLISMWPINIYTVTARIQSHELRALSIKKHVSKKEMARAKMIALDLVLYKQTHKLWFQMPEPVTVEKIIQVLDFATEA